MQEAADTGSEHDKQKARYAILFGTEMPESESDLLVAQKQREELLAGQHVSLSGMMSAGKAGTGQGQIDDVEL